VGKVRNTINIKAPASAIRKGGAKGVKHGVEHVLTESNKHVPHDEGTLERSGDTGVEETSDGARGSVSYDTPYAVKQHEDLTLHHDGKGQAKWLENTMAAESKTVGQIIGNAIRQEART
jgi:hypothetical protein